MQAVWSSVCRNPRSQKHLLILLLPSTDVELAGHVEHTVADVAASAVAYVLFSHRVQGMDPALGL
jgi:hypothetical protein